ncbi:hypothetical protein [Roseivirga pacifica]|uniref:hypothetical protein n=1 Tax=Roseivirga pacifica TaxID=1267423 RepID=UPI003BAA9C8C
MKKESRFGKLRYFFAELLILIIGITASFALNEYRLGNQEQRQEDEMLKSFSKNLEVDSLRLSSSIKVLEKQIEFAEKLLLSEQGVYTDSLVIFALSQLTYAPFDSNDITYQQMRSTGTSHLITNDSLATEIVGLYENSFEIVTLWSEIDGEHVRQKLIPFVEEHFPFEKNLNYTIADAATRKAFVKAAQSDQFSHLVQFGESYKVSTKASYEEALEDIRLVLAMINAQLEN